MVNVFNIVGCRQITVARVVDSRDEDLLASPQVPARALAIDLPLTHQASFQASSTSAASSFRSFHLSYGSPPQFRCDALYSMQRLRRTGFPCD